MKKEFRPTITEIKTIGNELQFQREYHNYKYPNNKYIKRYSKRSTFVGDLLTNYMKENFSTYKTKDDFKYRSTYGEIGANEDVIYEIEKEKHRKKGSRSILY